MDRPYDFGWLIGGSGVGGSGSALRLAQKGYRVGVLSGDPVLSFLDIWTI